MDPASCLMAQRILLVDDETGIRFGVSDALGAAGYDVTGAGSVAEALKEAGREAFDLAILDHGLPDGDALGLMRSLHDQGARFPIVFLTAHTDVALAVRAIKEGADNFLPKPVDMDGLIAVVGRLMEAARNRSLAEAELRKGRDVNPDPFADGGTSLGPLRDQAERSASATIPILIQGESGTGKGVLAKWIHAQGNRKDAPFVDLNCAGLRPEFLESELFGHDRGAFTGANQPKTGMLEVANHGTVFLDEIGDMCLEVQAQLLKAVEDRAFRRMGSTKTIKSDFRLIAATHRNLQEAVEKGSFRRDLFHRLAGMVLEIPPLRDRISDLPRLVARLLPKIGVEVGHPGIVLDPEALRLMEDHDWPGNIRELRNALERGAIMARGGTIRPRDIGLGVRSTPPATQQENTTWNRTLDQVAREHAVRVLSHTNGDKAEAARILGLPKSTFYTRIRDWDLDGPAPRKRQT